ncbi:N-acetylglucosamine-6-phosphate deacetylase [Gulosibacter macacae]|nr:N-acetylglucosamine-6-phosphate deacetylase [Gulosibacter macacae]
MAVMITSTRMLVDAPAAPRLAEGWVEIEDERIVSVGLGSPPRQADLALDGILAPGYVDVHAHGGGGAAFDTTDPADIDTVVAAHRSHGTTSLVASLVTSPIDRLETQVSLLANAVERGVLAGTHLEGPWLAQAFKGAHDPEQLRDPLRADVERLLAAGRGTVRMVTLAPELPGALEVMPVFVEAGVVVAVGHTSADFDTAREAIERGARGATHLFNAMPSLHHRRPGPILALWEDPRVTLEIIADGIHLRPELVAWVMRTAPGRVALITDAMAAAACGDGEYLLGDLEVTVHEGVARLQGTETIAGSTLTLDRAVRTAVAVGVSLPDALAAATAVPADYLGLAEVGRIEPGRYADLIELDDDLEVRRVIYRGS